MQVLLLSQNYFLGEMGMITKMPTILSAILIILMGACQKTESDSEAKGVLFHNTETEGVLKVATNLKEMRILSNLNVPKAVFAAYVPGQGDNHDFLINLYTAIHQINLKKGLVIATSGADQHTDFIILGKESELVGLMVDMVGTDDLASLPNDLKVVKVSTSGDRWLQDWGEFIGAGIDDQGDPIFGMFYVNRDRGLKEAIKTIAKMLDFSFISSDSYTASDGDYGGNLEATPDATVFVGTTMTPSQVDQLVAYGNTNLVQLDTSWLAVGHVDETLSVIPSNHQCTFPEGYTGEVVNYSLFAADPMMGLQVLYDYNGTVSEITYSSYASDASVYQINDIQKALKSMLIDAANSTISLASLDVSKISACEALVEQKYCFLVADNIYVQQVINANLEILSAATPCQNDDIVKIPQIYRSVDEELVAAGARNGISFLPGTVNMILLRDEAIIPDPWFDPYKEKVQQILTTKGINASFISDFSEYHDLAGEVHCGTNIMREPDLIYQVQ